MAALSESQIRAQAITLLEEKYSYSVIGKKLGRSKSWISKWAKRYKHSPNETLRNLYHGGRKSVLTGVAYAEKGFVVCRSVVCRELNQ